MGNTTTSYYCTVSTFLCIISKNTDASPMYHTLTVLLWNAVLHEQPRSTKKTRVIFEWTFVSGRFYDRSQRCGLLRPRMSYEVTSTQENSDFRACQTYAVCKAWTWYAVGQFITLNCSQRKCASRLVFIQMLTWVQRSIIYISTKVVRYLVHNSCATEYDSVHLKRSSWLRFTSTESNIATTFCIVLLQTRDFGVWHSGTARLSKVRVAPSLESKH